MNIYLIEFKNVLMFLRFRYQRVYKAQRATLTIFKTHYKKLIIFGSIPARGSGCFRSLIKDVLRGILKRDLLGMTVAVIQRRYNVVLYQFW